MGKPKHGNKDVREVIKYAESLGFVLVEKLGRTRHIKMQHRGNGAILIIPSTPSAPSWRSNLEADIRRYARNGRPAPER